jgi:alpha-mannosidase
MPCVHWIKSTAENTLENQFYKIELDPQKGAIKSIFDKELQLELLDPQSDILLGSSDL